MSKAKAAEPISAGLLGFSAAAPDGAHTYVIGGRVDSAAAEVLRFTDPGCAQVERPIGSSGFYVAALAGFPE